MKKTHILPAILGLTAMFSACNSDYEPTIDTSQDVQVTAFSLTADKNILVNLDSVYFSIDLVEGRIFNADSLPYGTQITKLIPRISTSSVSSATLTVSRAGKADTTYNYLANPGDSIDFSNGPVKLHLISSAGTYERTYSISVNVHKVKADSMIWGETAISALPGNFSHPTAQRTVNYASKYYSLVADGGKYYIVSQSEPAASQIDRRELNLGFTPDISSFTAATDACYLLDTNGRLYRSTDPSGNWTATALTWHSIIANYGSEIIGSVNDGGWTLQSYPSLTQQTLPEGFPVKSSSQSIEYRFPMSTSSNILIVGGCKADGTPSADCWSYDGSVWTQLSRTGLPTGLEAPVVVPYFTSRMSAAWVAESYSTLLLFGGRKADGTINRVVYQSLDFGMTWSKSDQLLQLPTNVPASYGAQGFVVERTINSSYGASRISKPITQWECPFIYVYGGYDANGNLLNSIWRAVIYRYTFKPIE